MFVMRRALLRGIATTVLVGMPMVLMARELNAAAATDACLCAGEALGHYGFPDGHPLGADRQGAFLKEAERRGLLTRVRACVPRLATNAEIGRFHTQTHIEKVMHAERDKLNDLGVAIETLGSNTISGGSPTWISPSGSQKAG